MSVTVPGEGTGLRSWIAEELAISDEDKRAWAVILTVIGVVIASRYLGSFGKASWMVDVFDTVGLDAAASGLDGLLNDPVHRNFYDKLYFALFRVVIYLVPAFLVGRYILRTSMRSLGWAVDFSWKHVRIYVGLYVLMVPLVVWASTQASFQQQYPFYDPAVGEGIWPYFVAWEAAYFLHFIGLELFFRGFAIHGLAPRFGSMAVAVMVIPYVMIHLSKPFPEAMGSIVAGTVLGILSLRSGTALLGGVLHFAVAITIDVLAY